MKDNKRREDNRSLCRKVPLFAFITLLLSTAYTTWGVAGRKRRLSAARRNAWAEGMLYRDNVSLTPLIRGRPLALRLNRVIYAR